MTGCSDDSSQLLQQLDSPVTLEDAASVMPDGQVPTNLCELVPAGANDGLVCLEADFCGNGGLCIESIGAPQPTCAQVCFPPTPEDFVPPPGWAGPFDGCPAACPAGDVCAVVLSDAGAPVVADLDLNGDPDVVVGACQSDAIGDRGPYQSCGEDGVCAEGARCLMLPGRAVGTCFPECDEACAAFDSYEARCSATSAEARVCLIACEPGDPAGCPAGLECTPNASGRHTCVR